jgi:catechol 2,3-dioxygenase-like lactoylglutathione lyase family enzyme
VAIKDGSLEHLDISVSNLERSGEFWAAFLKDLGYREFAKSATGWSWTNGESTVFLLQAEPAYVDPPYHRKRVGLNHLAFGVSDPKTVDAFTARLKERNVALLYGGPRTGRTTYAVFFEDPDRIKIEVVSPLVIRAVPAATRDSSITATEVITYAGALVTLAGLGTLLGTQYRQLGVIGRLAIPGLVAIAALLVARALPGQRARARRAQTSLVTLAVAAIGLFTGQLQAELLGGPDASIPPHSGYRILLVSALLSAVIAAAFLVRLRSGLLAAALGVSLLVATIASVAWLQLERGWAVELVFLGTAVILVAAAEYGRQQKVAWATEVLAFAGPSMAIITAFITAQDADLLLQIFGGLLAGAAFAASVYRGSAGYAFAGGIGLFAFVLDIEFRYFQSSLGFAVSLVISGLVLLGIALLLARLLPRLRR